MDAELIVTGVGVVSAIGADRVAFKEALLQGRHAFSRMQREGRQRESAFLGAEIRDFEPPRHLARQSLRTASLTAQMALAVLEQAWEEARLSEVDPLRIGLIVGGSNLQQRELTRVQDEYRDRIQFLRPTYALSFMDSDVCGFCTAQFGIRGIAYTVGGASASGQLAIIHAAQAVLSRQVDICIAIGALMDLSYWECHALRALGAMGTDRFANAPERASRPFDRDRDGFIFGECCGAVVIEAARPSPRSGVTARAALRGWAVTMDANRNSDPSLQGEVRCIRGALEHAGWSSRQIDYINPHGTGSTLGDQTEVDALRACDLGHAYVNATKSVLGHGLTAAGTVEVIATLLQMEAGRLHPTRNLESPIDESINWVGEQSVAHRVERALTLSMGFGGINTALCWRRLGSTGV